jgi:PAS domain S-box-containing protein
MNKKNNISKIIMIWGFAFLLSILAMFVLTSFYFDYQNFKNHKIEMRDNYIKQQKNMIKRQVLQVTDRIKYKKSVIEKNTREKVKGRVYEAYAIVENIYQSNVSKPKSEIIKMIVDALRPIRFHKEQGYYFITSLNGKELLFADKPQMEGINLINYKDSKGNFVIKDMIELVKNSKNHEGFYSYFWTKPNSIGNNFKKISFVKYFKPLNFFIGTGLYISDVEKSIQDELLDGLSRIRFGENGYIFVNSFDGTALVSNWKRFSGEKKLWEIFNKNPDKTKSIFQKEIKAAKIDGGDYIYYSFIKLKSQKESPKTSFIIGIPEWKWLIGAGVYLDEVEKDVFVMQKDFEKKVAKIFVTVLIFVSLIMTLFIFLLSKFSKKLQNDFTIFIQFFKKSVFDKKPINRDKIKFHELDILAINANKMLSDKIAAERELRNERERLFVTIRSIGDGVISTDTEGRITLMNAVAEHMTGYQTEEVLGKKLEEVFRIINAITLEQHENPVAKVLQSGKVVGLANHSKLISKNGDEYHIADSASPIRDSEGNILGVVLVFRDVTKEYEMKNDIKNKELRFQTIIEQSPISTQIFDTNGFVISANKAWENLWQAPADKIIGRYNAFNDEYLKDSEWMKLFKKAFKGETVNLPDLEYDPKESGEIGRKRIIKCVAFPIFNKDKIEMVVLTHQDITELKQAEEKMLMISKLKSIGTLAGGIAHDFNNILTGVFGNISLAKIYTPIESKSMKYILNAEHSMNRAVRLTKQLLIFSKGGSPVKENISIKEIVREVATFDLSGSNVKPIFKEEDNLWNVKADKGQIQQVFSNLVINANQAMPNGGNIYFSLENIFLNDINDFDLEAGKYVKISVKDEGVGITSENLKKIFDPYFTTKSTGNGLGLATTYSIIQKHNGYIDIQSEIGKGTVFTVYLPATDEKPIDFEKQQNDKENINQSAKILVMDDEEMIRELASDMIDNFGFEVDTASTGQETIEKYKESLEENAPFDLIIMDLTIPGGMGGKDAIPHILKLNPEAKVIVSSGYSSGETLSNYKELGFIAMIAKPYTIEKLQKILLEVLAT